MATRDISPPEELQLVRRAQQGEGIIFLLLLDRHFPPMYELLYRTLDDARRAEANAFRVFQEVRIHLGEFSPAYRLDEWLLALGCRAAREELQEKLRPRGTTPSPRVPPTSHAVAATLLALADPLRETLILSHYLHLSYPSISRVLEQPVALVRRRLHQARRESARMLGFSLDFPCRRLQEELDGYYDGELDPVFLRPLGEHLSHCLSCRKELALLKTLKNSLDQYPGPPPIPKPSSRFPDASPTGVPAPSSIPLPPPPTAAAKGTRAILFLLLPALPLLVASFVVLWRYRSPPSPRGTTTAIKPDDPLLPVTSPIRSSALHRLLPYHSAQCLTDHPFSPARFLLLEVARSLACSMREKIQENDLRFLVQERLKLDLPGWTGPDPSASPGPPEQEWALMEMEKCLWSRQWGDAWKASQRALTLSGSLPAPIMVSLSRLYLMGEQGLLDTLPAAAETLARQRPEAEEQTHFLASHYTATVQPWRSRWRAQASQTPGSPASLLARARLALKAGILEDAALQYRRFLEIQEPAPPPADTREALLGFTWLSCLLGQAETALETGNRHPLPDSDFPAAPVLRYLHLRYASSSSLEDLAALGRSWSEAPEIQRRQLAAPLLFEAAYRIRYEKGERDKSLELGKELVIRLPDHPISRYWRDVIAPRP